MEAAWRKSRNDNAIWRPGIPRADMEKRFAFHMLALVEDLRSGAYQPDPVRSFVINKGDGKTRTITALTLRDKVAQRAVLAAIEPLGESRFHPESYAYRPGRNIDMVMARIGNFLRRGFVWAVSADIFQCFDSIPHKQLLEATSEMIRDKEALRIIGQWIGMPRSRLRRVFSAGRGIPQGSVVSPFLCNVYLTALDHDLAERKICFVRFADNIFAMARSRQEAHALRGHISARLRKLCLSLNPEKKQGLYAVAPGFLSSAALWPPAYQFAKGGLRLSL
jgi:RNA-directed DNA polymerase